MIPHPGSPIAKPRDHRPAVALALRVALAFAALRAALDTASSEPGIDPSRLGVLGFSMGSLIAVQVAATDQRVRALALTGAFADAEEQVRYEFHTWGPISQWPAVMAARYGGMNLDRLRPIDIIASVEPRPVLLVAGSADTIVPPTMSIALFNAAREPKELYLVQGGSHGRYHETEGPAYEQRVVAFFDAALRP